MVAPMSKSMKWANALSTHASLEAAIKDAVEQVNQSFDGTPDLALVFISSAFSSEFSRLMPLLQEQLSVPALIGCSGGGIIGTNLAGEAQELEVEPALSLSVASLPGVTVRPFHISAADLPDLDSSPNAWIDLVGVPPEEEPHFILFADSGSARINDLLEGLDYAYPGAAKVGGLASSGPLGASHGLFCNYKLHREGTVGVALSGNITVETIVAQGCRPIGQVYRVTEGERNFLLGLEEQTGTELTSSGPSRTPLEVLQELIQNLSEEDRMLAQHSLFVGIAQNEFKLNLEHGDFLIRVLLGVDPKMGAIAIGDRVRPGQRIQFHLRDAEASADDLELMLKRHHKETLLNPTAPAAALLFACLGRGQGLYGEPNFDSRLFNRYFSNVPLSGFFCNGEIGPIGSSTFLHGYTSVFGILRQSQL